MKSILNCVEYAAKNMKEEEQITAGELLYLSEMAAEHLTLYEQRAANKDIIKALNYAYDAGYTRGRRSN